jgi:hypothetical protein
VKKVPVHCSVFETGEKPVAILLKTFTSFITPVTGEKGKGGSCPHQIASGELVYLGKFYSPTFVPKIRKKFETSRTLVCHYLKGPKHDQVESGFFYTNPTHIVR